MSLFFAAWLLAQVIAGEAGTCDTDARLAVAHIAANRAAAGLAGGWYGEAEPTTLDLAIAMNWQDWDDPTSGALYLFSANDEQQAAVQAIIQDAERTAQFECARGVKLSAWK